MRINPAEINGTITSTGVANAIGPYKFQPPTMRGVDVQAVSTNSTDVVEIIAVPCGADQTDANNYIATFASQTCPVGETVAGDYNELKSPCDIYVYASTCTGTITVRIIGNKQSAASSGGK